MSPESKMQKLAEVNQAFSKDSAAKKRLEMLFDEGTFVETCGFAMAGEEPSGVVTGYGYVEGELVYAYAQDSEVAGGAVGRVHGEKIAKVYALAAKTGCPVVAVFDSNGARLDEGNDALAAYGEMLMWSNNLSGVVPQISVVLGVCAGCAAMLATSADLVVMSEKAELFMTPPFTAKANGERVEGAGTAENAAKAGVAHIVCADDAAAMQTVKELLMKLPENNLAVTPIAEFAENENGQSTLAAAFADIEHADVKSVLEAVADADSVVELQSAFGQAAYTALAGIQGSTVGLIATDKTNGALDSDASAKIARFVRMCDAFAIPIVTFVDTEGFAQSAKGELAGSIREAAKLAHAYAEATCPKISVVIGSAYGPAYIALAGKNANADVTIAWPSAVISALKPEATVEFLWHDKLKDAEDVAAKRAELVTEYVDTAASPFEAAKGGSIDQVIDPALTRGTIINALDMLAGKRVSKLPKKHGNMPF